MKVILFIFGTRPEAIKLAPLIKEFSKNESYIIKVCVTAQHREMLDQVLQFFQIIPDYDLDLMQPNQSLFGLTANALLKLEPVFNDAKPDLVFVQGDTTTVLAGALAAFYKNVKIAHVEAGLRSNDKYSPFPEEINRILTSNLTQFHFVPTEANKKNLYREGIEKNIFNVGNTVIDALQLGLALIKEDLPKYESFFSELDFSKRIILVTCHRRESFGEPFVQICEALKELSLNFPDIEIVYPVHLNPNVKTIAYQILSGIENIKLISPLEYPYLIWLMNHAHIVITDSGGIQEEAPALGKPVLVLRDVTERQEGITAGTAKLVGTDKGKIIAETTILLTNEEAYIAMAKAVNPYGDGTASRQIVNIIDEFI